MLLLCLFWFLYLLVIVMSFLLFWFLYLLVILMSLLLLRLMIHYRVMNSLLLNCIGMCNSLLWFLNMVLDMFLINLLLCLRQVNMLASYYVLLLLYRWLLYVNLKLYNLSRLWLIISDLLLICNLDIQLYRGLYLIIHLIMFLMILIMMLISQFVIGLFPLWLDWI